MNAAPTAFKNSAAGSGANSGAKSGAKPAATRLLLTDFRSYAALDIRPAAGLVVLTGENGAGKTNLIEAISLLSPDRKSVV